MRQVTLAKRRFKLAVQLQVIDNGPGIPDDIRDRIFYPLVSGRENGSGLGLSLAQSFVEQHHGAIEVESRPAGPASRSSSDHRGTRMPERPRVAP